MEWEGQRRGRGRNRLDIINSGPCCCALRDLLAQLPLTKELCYFLGVLGLVLGDDVEAISQLCANC